MMARSQCQLIVRQQPQRAQVVQENNPKNRKPIDPPPIIELKYDDRDDPSNSQWLVSPRTFMMVTLMPSKEGEDPVPGKYLIGQTVSSLHRLKDINNKDGGFFVFGDISARKLGHYRLRFSLYDTSKDTEEVVYMGHVDSEVFPVLPQRDFGSMSESSHLTRTFSDQGVKLRVRKDNRAMSSVSGTKRSYNASPPETSSPSIHSGIYGGAVQDHHYASSAHSPVAKRHRSSGEYDAASQLYQGLAVGENQLGQYNNSIPSGTRSWSGSEHHRAHSGYGQQQSPLGMSMLGGRVQSMSVQNSAGWQGMHQQNALPSPTPSASNPPQTTYPSVSSQQQSSSLFGDPGAASSIPRNYYSNGYPCQTQGQYQGQHAGDVQQTYPELQMAGSSIPDAGGLSSGQSQGYNQGYLPSGNLYGTEATDVPGVYGYINETHQKF